MADYDRFRHGGVHYPLDTSTANSLLRDADPALFFTIDYLATVLCHYIGDRLLAEARLCDLKLPSAVVHRMHVEPAPFLLAQDFRFPALAVYRKNEEYSDRTISWSQDVATWELAYLLPPLIPEQVKRLQPILRAAAVVMRKALRRGADPSYSADVAVLTNAGIAQARLTAVKYGGYEPIQEIPTYYRALVGTVTVTEQDMPDGSSFEKLSGMGATFSDTSADGTEIDVTTIQTGPAPTLTNVSPSVGTKTGGTVVTLTGTNFPTSQTPRVWIGTGEATSVVVLSATSLRCTTAAQPAYPTSLEDVLVRTLSGQQARLSAAFTFTSP